MWKLKSIYAKNLCAFKEVDYRLNQGHTTLVFGNNLDNDSQVSNGSGKSALIEAIAIGLTGETLRKIKMDEIINDAEDEAKVCLTLINDTADVGFEISRTISRKAPQQIELVLTIDGEPQRIVQASVADYNKYVLETIGLTKDDIFANYILSKHKYTSFLSSSDREKKEIINRFSNGIIVDESIAALQKDMEPISADLQEAEKKVASCQGSVNSLEEAISKAIEESAEKSKTKAQRIEEWKKAITQKRAYIREQDKLADDSKARLKELNAIYNKMVDLEEGKKSSEEIYDSIVAMFAEGGLKLDTDYKNGIKCARESLLAYQKRAKDKEAEIAEHNKECAKQSAAHDKLLKAYEKFTKTYDKSLSDVNERISSLLGAVKALENSNEELERERRKLNSRIATISNILVGVIVCPKCKHEFLLDPDISLDALRKELTEKNKQNKTLFGKIEENQASITDSIQKGKTAREEQRNLQSENAEWSSKITKSQTELDTLTRKSSALKNELEDLNNEIAGFEKAISNNRNDMFDEAYEIVDDATDKVKSTIKQSETNISNANGSIQSYEESIKDIEHASETDMVDTLRESKAKYEKELSNAIKEKETIEQKLAALKKQEATFIEFKTHLANSKIEALSQITNEFLEAINSDIRISFSGFTVLKSGKIRDKISISLIRDGVDCGSFDKFSEGEKARANLANILALHKLTNVNCEDGKGLDLLVLDEILEACDEAGLASMFEALNRLQITSLVVSHGNIAENYPYKLIINKQNDISFI